jgi:hypothetical protein
MVIGASRRFSPLLLICITIIILAAGGGHSCLGLKTGGQPREYAQPVRGAAAGGGVVACAGQQLGAAVIGQLTEAVTTTD